MASASSSSSSSAIEEIKAGLVQLQELEEKLSNAGWQPNVLADATASSSSTTTTTSTSPTSVNAAAKNDANAVLQRYIAARDLYLQRRLQAKFVEHIQTFDPRQETFDMPCVPNEDEDDDIAQRHAAALTNLETTVQKIHSQASQLRDGYQANKSNREELQRMLQDMEEEDNDKDDLQNDDEEEVNDIDLENEQERIEELQKTKRQLEEELASLQQKATEVQERTRHKHNEIALLERQIEGDNDDGIDGGIQNEETMRKKIEQLREMKSFYDSMRGVLEELGGVKIDSVEELPANRHLRLILVLYDEYKVEVELEVYRQRFLKLVDAKWTMTAGGSSSSSSSNEAATPMIGGGGGGGDSDGFSLKVEPLHDLVQTAKTTLGPPHDLRFVVREALARLRIQKDRYQDLSILRQNVLTKIEDGGNQVVCSLNDGIVIVMRLYEHWVRVEQIVGVGGWDTGTTKRIQDAIKVDENSTPTSIVSQVRDEIENIQNSGFVKPGTPKLPQKVFGEGGGGDS